jgi:hypothetical protein
MKAGLLGGWLKIDRLAKESPALTWLENVVWVHGSVTETLGEKTELLFFRDSSCFAPQDLSPSIYLEFGRFDNSEEIKNFSCLWVRFVLTKERHVAFEQYCA